jgi:hypothetical protein
MADHLKGSGLGLINPALYKMGAVRRRPLRRHRRQQPADPTVAGYTGSRGWDPVTGLGTANAANLVPDLVTAAGH